MKHKHHIIPKHMGGSDDPENLVELTIEEHAEAHRKLYEEYGHQEDYLAWQGLAGLMTKEELVKEMLSMAGKRGAAITNSKKAPAVRKYPVGVDGRKIRKKKNWYNNGEVEGQFELDNQPEGWVRGRLSKSMAAATKASADRFKETAQVGWLQIRRTTESNVENQSMNADCKNGGSTKQLQMTTTMEMSAQRLDAPEVLSPPRHRTGTFYMEIL